MSSYRGLQALLHAIVVGVEVSHRRMSIPEGVVKRGIPSIGWWYRGVARFRLLGAILVARR